MTRQIDHIVYTVLDLDKAIATFKEKLGTKAIFSGYHENQGTKNALINLDDGKYLELLAADVTKTQLKPKRWMGVDLLTDNQITLWAIKTNRLERDSTIVKLFDPKMGSIISESRYTAYGKKLSWEMIVPLAEPEVEIVPFMVDWARSETHPHDELPDMGCELVELYGTHPDPDQFVETFEKLGLDFRIVKSKEVRLKTIIKCPKGNVEI